MKLTWMPTRAGVIDGLKSLPLTIILTVLIWMYAEAQFTLTEDASRGGPELTLPAVPLWIAEPQEYEPRRTHVVPAVEQVEITVTGNAATIKAIQTLLAAHQDTGVRAYLEVSPDTKPETAASGIIHYNLPTGITLVRGPKTGDYVLHESSSSRP